MSCLCVRAAKIHFKIICHIGDGVQVQKLKFKKKKNHFIGICNPTHPQLQILKGQNICTDLGGGGGRTPLMG